MYILGSGPENAKSEKNALMLYETELIKKIKQSSGNEKKEFEYDLNRLKHMRRLFFEKLGAEVIYKKKMYFLIKK